MKKHFIFLGNMGVIYYSWLLCVLFLAIIFCLEGTAFINPPMVLTFAIFALLLVYTWNCSYIALEEPARLRLPYQKTVVLDRKPVLLARWKSFRVYRAQVSKHQTIDYVVFHRKRGSK